MVMAENRALIPEPVAMYTQTESLKTANDLNKKLVSGDFEKQYLERMEKTSRRRPVKAIFAAAIGAVVVWLVVLTVVRTMQIARLRQEVDDLTANVLALSANVKNLNQKLADSTIFGSNVRELDDTIYADANESPDDWTKKTEKAPQDSSLEKLHNLTVTDLEDDSDLDDDEDGDDEYEESGDWYVDYDTRRSKIGTSSMVRLEPGDFTDSVLMINQEKDGFSNIQELKRMLNENPENPDIAFPPLPASTPVQEKEERIKRSVFPDEPLVVDAPSPDKTVSKTEESPGVRLYEPPKASDMAHVTTITRGNDRDRQLRRKTKKFVPSVEAPPNKVALQAVTRTVRSDNEGSTRRPFIAAHFHGNTSHLSIGVHEHYKGNGLLRVAHGAPHDVWYPSLWTISSPHPRPTLTRNGHVHVHHTGVYLVYVQIYYLDSHDVISWVLHRTNSEIEGRETLLQCAQSAHSLEPMDKPNSCFSAAALFLKAGDRLAVRNTGGDRHSIMEPEKSFIGLIKLADADDPNEDW